MPADDAGWNLVAKGNQQDGRVRCQLAHQPHDVTPDAATQSSIVEERDVLRPRQPDHHPQAAASRLVQKITTRRGVETDGIQAEVCYLLKVLGDLAIRRVLIPVCPRRKGSVRDALDKEPPVLDTQKLPIGGGARRRSGYRKVEGYRIDLGGSAHGF